VGLLVVHIALALLFLSDRSPGTDAALSGFPLDDAWIHLVYAQSLAHFGLPYYNQGIAEAGFTSPLWVILGALAQLVSSSIGIPVVGIMKALSVLFAWLTSVAIFEICFYFTRQPLPAFLGGLYTAAFPLFAFAQVSGMEVCLAACLSGWAIFLLLKRRYLASGLLLGLGSITRPENAILVLLVAMWALLFKRNKSDPSRLNSILRLLLPSVIFLSLWSLTCILITGHPFPNTFYAKFSHSHFWDGFGRIMSEVVFKMPAMFLLSGALLYVLGAGYMLKTIKKTKLTLLIIVYPWLFLGGIALSRNLPPLSGSYYYWFRYLVPAIPFIFIPMAGGVGFLWKPTPLIAAWKSRANVLKASKLLAVLLVLLSWIKVPSQLEFRSNQFAWNCQNINEVQVELGRWVNEHTPADAVIAVNDSGALRYFGKRKTIDLIGLNDQSVLFDRELKVNGSWTTSTLMSFLRNQNVHYLVIFPSWFAPLVQSEEFGRYFKMIDYRKSENYTVSAAPQDLMAVYYGEY
jgi:hypothetical protein